MLPVYSNISQKALHAINQKIYSILEENFLTNDQDLGIDDIDFLFPSYLIIERPQWCMQKFKEFTEIIKDNFLRDRLNPIHEYILYHLLNYEIEFLKEENRLPNIDYSKFEDETGEFNISEDILVEDIEGYLDIMFEDYDFLSVEAGMESELDDYLDLMPNDIRQKVVRDIIAKKSEQTKTDILIQSILYAIEQIENQPTLYVKCNESQLNDHIASIVKKYLLDKEIIFEREKLQGFALVESGECDFYVYDSIWSNTLAIGESKNYKHFRKTIKQLLGYMTRNTEIGFTINIIKDSEIQQAKKTIINNLQSFNNQNPFETQNIEDRNKFIISLHKMPENSNTYILLFHLFLNLNTKFRKNIAKESRTNKKIKKKIEKQQ